MMDVQVALRQNMEAAQTYLIDEPRSKDDGLRREFGADGKSGEGGFVIKEKI
jgi:hypothetical protein